MIDVRDTGGRCKTCKFPIYECRNYGQYWFQACNCVDKSPVAAAKAEGFKAGIEAAAKACEDTETWEGTNVCAPRIRALTMEDKA